MPDYKNARRDLNSVTAEFLLTDIDVGITFMDVAGTSRDQKTVLRNHKNAMLAYDTVLGFLAKLSLTEIERQSVQAKLALLRARLQASGVIV